MANPEDGVREPTEQLSLLDETNAYIEEAEQRRATLPPLEAFDVAVAKFMARGHKLAAMTRELEKAARGSALGDMVRHPDHETSIGAAEAVAPHLSKLQRFVLRCFEAHGPMTDEELEGLPEVKALNLGPSTARRRRTDLCKKVKLIPYGHSVNTRGNKMTRWGVHV